MRLRDELHEIKEMLYVLVERQHVREWYEVDQFALLVGKAPFTVREWCRLGRIKSEKRKSGRGSHPQWVISHTELERFQRHGLLPLKNREGR